MTCSPVTPPCSSTQIHSARRQTVRATWNRAASSVPPGARSAASPGPAHTDPPFELSDLVVADPRDRRAPAGPFPSSQAPWVWQVGPDLKSRLWIDVSGTKISSGTSPYWPGQ